MGICKKILPTFGRVPCKAPKMPTLSSGGYQPGIAHNHHNNHHSQPYSKWSTDRDEVQVDYDQLNPSAIPTRKSYRGVRGGGGVGGGCFSGRKGVLLKLLLLLVLFFCGLIFGYIIRRSLHQRYENPYKCSYGDLYERYSPEVSTLARSHINTANLANNLRSYTHSIHLSGCHDNNNLTLHLADQLNKLGITTDQAQYQVLLSFPDWEQPNEVTLIDNNGSIKYEVQYHNLQLQHPELYPYMAYSPNATIQGEVVFANHGEEVDFKKLNEDNNSCCEDRIVMMRMGQLTTSTMVANAARHGALGVILYHDTNSNVVQHLDQINWVVHRGTVLPHLTGDPLTPDMPALDGMYRLSEDEADLPDIPAQPVAYQHAQDIISNLKLLDDTQDHDSSEDDSDANRTESKERWQLRLDVHNERVLKTITNLFGYIEGQDENDRYVIVGCHYDSWTYGASDPNSGTAVLMEVAAALQALVDKGWQPRRTIIFAHWDAGEQSLSGSYEWVQENEFELAERTVAYIDLDAAIRGNSSFTARFSPMIDSVITDVITKISHPLNPSSSTQPSSTSSQPPPPPGYTSDDLVANSVYQQWRQRDADVTAKLLGGGEDYSAFAFTLGVTCISLGYESNAVESVDTTLLDTYSTMSRIIDPGFTAHTTMSHIVAELVLQLSSHTDVGYDATELSAVLMRGYDEVHAMVTQPQPGDAYNKQFELLQFAIGNFTHVAETFMVNYRSLDPNSVLEHRRFSDRLLQLPRVFIHQDGLPGRPMYKNLLYGPSRDVTYSAVIFPGIRDSFAHKDVAALHKHLSLLTVATRSATQLLDTNIFTRT